METFLESMLQTSLIVVGAIAIVFVVYIVLFVIYSLFSEEKTPLKDSDPFKDKVKCETCKCWLDKSDAHRVDLGGDRQWSYYDYIISWNSIDSNNIFYCRIHKPNYTKKIGNSFFKELEVTEDGEPVGYKKLDKTDLLTPENVDMVAKAVLKGYKKIK